jgi:hypothetical protein
VRKVRKAVDLARLLVRRGKQLAAHKCTGTALVSDATLLRDRLRALSASGYCTAP